MTPVEFLEQKLAGMLETLIRRDGFRAPFFGVAVSANGSLLGIRYDAAPGPLGLSFTTLTEHVEQNAFHIPVTFVFVEPRSGKLTAFRIEAGDSEPREVRYVQ